MKEDYLRFSKIKIKNEEIDIFDKLISELQKENRNNYIFDDFFVGFSIPQIGKEFDLLRVGEKSVVNIEIKREAEKEKILRQLLNNQYYLSFLNKEVFKFTYIYQENKIYTLDKDNQLLESNLQTLVKVLENQITIKDCCIERLFNPSDYLVSPFNSTDKFIEGKYFLTNRQQEIKNDIFKFIDGKGGNFISIKGGAGTGKTLLTYDIANEFISKQGQNILIIHCGLLNDGHFKLKKECSWNIIPVKAALKVDLSQYFLIILDECQRIYPPQLSKIIDHIRENQKNIIFSYDPKQYLRDWENNNNIQKIIEEDNHSKKYELNTKIRTNAEIASFIKCLFRKKEEMKIDDYSNIILNYFENKDESLSYIKFLRENDWKYINYTPERNWIFPFHTYNIEEEKDNSHKVIGQEFENVVVVIDNSFCYVDGRLSIKNFTHEPYYNPVKMLYQIITRVRKKLNIIIVNNPEIFERCVQILRKDG